jgi:hypothetical protein
MDFNHASLEAHIIYRDIVKHVPAAAAARAAETLHVSMGQETRPTSVSLMTTRICFSKTHCPHLDYARRSLIEYDTVSDSGPGQPVKRHQLQPFIYQIR